VSQPTPPTAIQHDQEVGDLTIHYAEVQGSGPPMVMLHGIGMDWRVWQSVSRRLAPHFHLYLPDLRGHGQSDKPARGYSLADYASDVEELIAWFGLTDVTLVGSSLGGMIAIALEASPSVVSARVLVDPPLVRGAGAKRSLFERILAIKQVGVSEQEQCQAIFRALQGESEGAGNGFVRYMAEAWTACAEGVLAEALHPIETPAQIEAALAAIESPTLIMRGNSDRGSVLSEAAVGAALDLLQDGEVRYFPKSGHAIHGTEPAMFVDAIREFTGQAVTGGIGFDAECREPDRTLVPYNA